MYENVTFLSHSSAGSMRNSDEFPRVYTRANAAEKMKPTGKKNDGSTCFGMFNLLLGSALDGNI